MSVNVKNTLVGFEFEHKFDEWLIVSSDHCNPKVQTKQVHAEQTHFHVCTRSNSSLRCSTQCARTGAEKLGKPVLINLTMKIIVAVTISTPIEHWIILVLWPSCCVTLTEIPIFGGWMDAFSLIQSRLSSHFWHRSIRNEWQCNCPNTHTRSQSSSLDNKEKVFLKVLLKRRVGKVSHASFEYSKCLFLLCLFKMVWRSPGYLNC